MVEGCQEKEGGAEGTDRYRGDLNGKVETRDASRRRRDTLKPVAWNVLSVMKCPGVCWPVWKNNVDSG